MVPDTPESRDVYDRAQELFYANFAHLFSPQGGPIHRDEVPYESGTLPCWRITPSGDKRGTILFHGGNDSLLEEFTDLLLYLARGGYEILAFEGPGQGAALRKSGLTFTPEWEKPVGAVLDFYGAEDVTIVGVSLGGELAMRAAAMEPRIRRVVAWCVLPSIYGALMADKPAEIRTTLEQLLSENSVRRSLPFIQGSPSKIHSSAGLSSTRTMPTGRRMSTSICKGLRHLPLSLWPTRLHRMYCSLAPEKI